MENVKTVLMSCGHTNNAYITCFDGSKKPCCAICSNEELMENKTDDNPNLTGRKAICTYGCKASICDSSLNLAFFKYQPKESHDAYYCGCYGWD